MTAVSLKGNEKSKGRMLLSRLADENQARVGDFVSETCLLSVRVFGQKKPGNRETENRE